MSCAGTPAQKSQDMQKGSEIIISESQGGADQPGFKMIKNEQELQNFANKGNSGIVELGKEPAKSSLVFPKNKKVVLYNLGMFRSGSHTVTQIKSVSVKDNVLYVEVPAVESGGMEIQVISNPWFIFAVPSEYQFNSVALKYSK
jgi:hypothetical protein